MKYILLGGFFETDEGIVISENSYGAIANANNLLQLNLIDGFSEISVPFEYYSIPQIGAYPFLYKKLIYRSKNEDRYLPFLNLKGIKHFSQELSARSKLEEILSNSVESICFIVYDYNLAFLQALYALKKKHNFSLCLIIPDLVKMTGHRPTLINKFFFSYKERMINKIVPIVDFYVLLTQEMNKLVNPLSKPFIVMEGIYNEKHEGNVLNIDNTAEYLFYSGALNKRNGLDTLVNAFTFIKNPDLYLYICGKGDLEDFIKNKSKQDKRIVYLGQISYNQVLAYEKGALALVNPRPNTEIFTKYSFPSKTLEYLASGNPVLMYKLDGVPQEYYKYCYELNGLTPRELSQNIIRILKICKHIDRGGKDFILKYKTPTKQVMKIIKMIENANNFTN